MGAARMGGARRKMKKSAGAPMMAAMKMSAAPRMRAMERSAAPMMMTESLDCDMGAFVEEAE